MEMIKKLEAAQKRQDHPHFRAGDTIRVHLMIREGEKERVQIYEGVVIARNGAGVSESMTVRKVSSGIGVERVFPVHSPRIEKIEVVSIGRVRRAKLYYLRNLSGKSARIRTKRERKGT